MVILMTYNPENKNPVESPHKKHSSFWRRVLENALDDLQHHIGQPALLERVIKTGVLAPYSIVSPADTLWTRSVVRWDTWLETSSSSVDFRPFTVDYKKPDATGCMSGSVRVIPEAENLIREEIIDGFKCDISLIKGISNSKSEGYDIAEIDELPMQRSPEKVKPVTQEHLRVNMNHHGLRLDRMLFAEYPWSERRYYWHNDDGSHHFSAARYQARLLQIPVALTGRLYRYHVNTSMVRSLLDKWHFCVLPKQQLFGNFYDAMKAFKCPFAWSALPENMHDPEMSKVELCIVWLERENSKANSVAAVLAASGFPDFGVKLSSLL